MTGGPNSTTDPKLAYGHVALKGSLFLDLSDRGLVSFDALLAVRRHCLFEGIDCCVHTVDVATLSLTLTLILTL